jgi:hypothetical protein
MYMGWHKWVFPCTENINNDFIVLSNANKIHSNNNRIRWIYKSPGGNSSEHTSVFRIYEFMKRHV